MARIIGLLFSGFMVRLYAAAMAIYVAVTVAHFVTGVFAQVNNGMSVLG